MTPVALLAFALAVTAVAVLWYRERARTRAGVRLSGLIGADIETPMPAVVDERRERLRTFPPRHRVLAVLTGILVGGAVSIAGAAIEIAVAIGALAGVIAYLAEEYVAEQRVARIETQLSDAIDLLVGALRAGSALLAGLEASLRESRAPIRPYLQEVVGRIRLGDDPADVLAELPRQLPFETCRLFSTALAVHWEVGGSLASTLATVGRTIRDRIELSRRVRSQGIEAHFSVAAVMAIAYVLAYLMWRTNPERVEAFLRSGAGTEMTAGVIVLQAIGLVWMSRISRSGF
jgi:tight adherence protein B